MLIFHQFVVLLTHKTQNRAAHSIPLFAPPFYSFSTFFLVPNENRDIVIEGELLKITLTLDNNRITINTTELAILENHFD